MVTTAMHGTDRHKNILYLCLLLKVMISIEIGMEGSLTAEIAEAEEAYKDANVRIHHAERNHGKGLCRQESEGLLGTQAKYVCSEASRLILAAVIKISHIGMSPEC